MFVRRLPVLLFLFALSAWPASAQTQQPHRHSIFSIGGNLLDSSDHHAMENVLVSLKVLTGPTVTTAYTRANGEFQFDGLSNGDYILEIVVRDYNAVRETIEINGGSRLGLAIFLVKTGKAADLPPQMSISAHQLSAPHRARDEFEKAMSLIALKSDYRGAITQLQRAIKDFPTYYEAYAEEGAAYYQLKEMGPAEEALRKSIDLSSGQYADAMFTLASLLTDTNRFSEAEAVSRQAMTVDKSSWRGPFELARALIALKRPEEAEENAEQARALAPDNPAVYLILANIHIQRRDYPTLVKDLDEYLRLSPTGSEADQARKTKERAENIINSAKRDSATSGQEKSTEQDDDYDPASDQNALSPDENASPGLPPSPPPSAEKH